MFVWKEYQLYSGLLRFILSGISGYLLLSIILKNKKVEGGGGWWVEG